MLSPEETVAFFDEHFTRTAFRLETLDGYAVASDGDDVARYLNGEPEPSRDVSWRIELASDERAGKHRSRVHVVRTPLNDYLRYECEWGYVANTEAGEEIRILDLSTMAAPPGLLNEDFWLFDDRHVLRMIYDDEGQFHGANTTDDPAPFVACRDAAMAASEDFTAWWDAHPEFRRTNQPSRV